MFPAPVGIGFQPSPETAAPRVGMEILGFLLFLPSCERNLLLLSHLTASCIPRTARALTSSAALATSLAEKNKPRTESQAKYRAKLGEEPTWQCSSIKIKNGDLKLLLVDDPRLLTASTIWPRVQPAPEGPARPWYPAKNGTGRRPLLLLALGYGSAVHAPQINEWSGCVSSQFTCNRNNTGLEPGLAQLRFGMQLILREGGWQSLVRLYLLLEANLIYSSIHLLHSNFLALVDHSPAVIHKVLLLEHRD